MTTTTTFDDVAALDSDHVGDIYRAGGAILRREVGRRTRWLSEGLVLLLRCIRWPADSARGHRPDDRARNRWCIGDGPRRVSAAVKRSPHQGHPRR